MELLTVVFCEHKSIHRNGKFPLLTITGGFLFLLLWATAVLALSPETAKRVHDENIRRMCHRSPKFEDRFSGLLSEMIYNFRITDEDKKQLKAAGFTDEEIEDFVAKSQYQPPKQHIPLEGKIIRSPDSARLAPLATGGDNILRWELYRFASGRHYLHFVNQCTHLLRIISLTPMSPSKNLTSDNQRLSPTRFNSHTRFGERITDHYAVELFPHPHNVDTSRWDNWKKDNSFVGKSKHFRKFKKYVPPASIRKDGPYYHHEEVWAEDTTQPLVAKFVCKYSYRDNDGALFEGEIIVPVNIPGEVDASKPPSHPKKGPPTQVEDDFWSGDNTPAPSRSKTHEDSTAVVSGSDQSDFWGIESKSITIKEIDLDRLSFWAGNQETAEEVSRQKRLAEQAIKAASEVEKKQKTEASSSIKSGPQPTFVADGKEWLVGEKDLSWHQAKNWIDSLGGNWRTPKCDELESLFRSVKWNSPIGERKVFGEGPVAESVLSWNSNIYAVSVNKMTPNAYYADALGLVLGKSWKTKEYSYSIAVAVR